MTGRPVTGYPRGMNVDDISKLRQDLASRLVTVLDLPTSVAGGRPAFDKYRVQADPGQLRDLAVLIADRLPADTEVLVGMELGGVPLATALALHTGLPWALLRRTQRANTTSAIAGTPIDGRRAVLVKDGVIGGGTLIPATATLRDNGAIITHAAIGISWNPGLAETLSPAGITSIAGLSLADLQQAWRTA